MLGRSLRVTPLEDSEPRMPDDRFIAVGRPSRHDGIGRALQIAYREGCRLPAHFQAYLEKLDRRGIRA